MINKIMTNKSNIKRDNMTSNMIKITIRIMIRTTIRIMIRIMIKTMTKIRTMITIKIMIMIIKKVCLTRFLQVSFEITKSHVSTGWLIGGTDQRQVLAQMVAQL